VRQRRGEGAEWKGGGGKVEGGSYYVSHGKGTGIMSNYE
jgi:hypothetical protein